MPRPDLSRVPVFYHNYINLVTTDELMPALRQSSTSFIDLLRNIPAEKRNHRYAEGKWSISEIVQHIIDAERIFSYRALCFARKDTTPLPGFDEKNYVAHAKTQNRVWEDLVEEFLAVRKTTEMLFASFDEEQLESEGNLSQKSIYVRAIGFICAGHCLHHQRVIRERYLV